MSDASDRPVIGIDLGGTNITAGLVGAGHRVLARHKVDTEADGGPAHVLDRIAGAVDELIAGSGHPRSAIAAVGIGVPGAVDAEAGRVLEAVNLRWTDLDVGRKLRRRTKLPVVVDNDVNVGTWGEYRAGAAKGATAVFGVFIGTGIGGAFIFNDAVYAGAFGTAGEIGHTTIDVFGSYGSRTVEQLASRTAVANRLVAMARAHHPSDLPKIAGDKWPAIRSGPIADAFDADDALTVEVVGEAARVVGAAIANVVTLFSLDRVVIGGGLTEALGKPFVTRVRRHFRACVFPARCRACRVVESRLGDDAGIVGAALLAREHAA